MPYFKTKEVNILLIHIPKTGGTSLEKYFSKKYNCNLQDYSTLYKGIFNKANARHNTYLNIITTSALYRYIKFENLTIITVVRNPYHRIISDLFYLSKIKLDTPKNVVYNKIKLHVTMTVDNHTIPQHYFLIDSSGNMIPDIKILKTENLTNMMHDIGFDDFNLHENKNEKEYNYMNYLNNDSIKFINQFYDKDFQYFGYEKIVV